MAIASNYNVELRNKNGELRQYLTPFVTSMKWTWNRIGGCGRASIKLSMPYREIDFAADDDIQIRIKTKNSLNLVFIVGKPDDLDTQKDLDFMKFLASLGHTYTVKDDDDSSYDPTVFDAVILSESAIGAKIAWLKTEAVGILTADGNHNNEFELASSGSNFKQMDTDMKVRDATHFITAKYVGNDVIDMISGNTFTGDMEGWANDVKILGSSDDDDTEGQILAVEAGGTLEGGVNTAAERRVFFIARRVEGLTQDAKDLLARAIRWVAHDEIESTKLVYRGWVSMSVPTLKIGQEITLDVRGYYDKLRKIIIQDNGDDKIYENESVLNIVDDIIDTYVTPNSIITKGNITAGAFGPDELTFKTSVFEALRTLADLEGNIEYGVNENLEFFWVAKSDVVRPKHRFFVGNNIEIFERRIDWNRLINRIYFEGGEVAGSKFLRTLDAADSITSFFLAETIVSNSSITTSSVADQFLSSRLKQNSSPQILLRGKVKNTDIRLEDTLPIGKIQIFDAEHDQSLFKWGKTASGGDNLIYGLVANGGSGKVWGGVFGDQIDKVNYELSDTDNRVHMSISTKGTVSETSATLKRIELLLNSLRQK